MTKTLKLILAALLVSFGATVFAQCMPMNAPGPPRLWDGVRGCYVPQGTPAVYSGNNGQVVTSDQDWGRILASQAIRIPQGQQIPNGYCSWGGRVENMAISGLIGAVVGVLAGDNRRAAAKGAALGMMVGTFVPCHTLQQASLAPESRRVVVQGGETTVVPAKCDFGDGVVVYTYEGKSGCDKIAAKMSSRQTASSDSANLAPQEQASATGCGVKLAGVLIKELSQQNGSTCQADKKKFVERFIQECRGKGGSDEADIACGRRIEI